MARSRLTVPPRHGVRYVRRRVRALDAAMNGVTVVAWSTRELAELTGTTLRAVRHYHQVGLLIEPERRANGYKQYGVTHLVRVLRIKRLTDLGFSLAQIAEMGDADDHPEEALRTLDAELGETIERLQRARIELQLLLARSAPTDLPPDFAPATVDADMTEADRSFVVVLTRILGPQGLQTYADMLQNGLTDPALAEFDALPADADEATREDLAARLAPFVRALHDAYPGLRDTAVDAPRGARYVRETMDAAMRDVYNPAQVAVVRRTHEIAGTGKKF